MGILSLLLLLPLLGATLIALLPAGRARLARGLALVASGATGLLAWSLLGRFQTGQAAVQFTEWVQWNPRLGSAYAVGLDGFSFPMVLLATLLCFIALRSKSIWPGVLLHWLVASTMDFMASSWWRPMLGVDH